MFVLCQLHLHLKWIKDFSCRELDTWSCCSEIQIASLLACVLHFQDHHGSAWTNDEIFPSLLPSVVAVIKIDCHIVRSMNKCSFFSTGKSPRRKYDRMSAQWQIYFKVGEVLNASCHQAQKKNEWYRPDQNLFLVFLQPLLTSMVALVCSDGHFLPICQDQQSCHPFENLPHLPRKELKWSGKTNRSVGRTCALVQHLSQKEV